MPTISMFYGIVVRMYCDRSEHNPPHFHAYYQEHSAVVSIDTCEIISGRLPAKQAKLVTAWAELHKDELRHLQAHCECGRWPVVVRPANHQITRS